MVTTSFARILDLHTGEEAEIGSAMTLGHRAKTAAPGQRTGAAGDSVREDCPYFFA